MRTYIYIYIYTRTYGRATRALDSLDSVTCRHWKHRRSKNRHAIPLQDLCPEVSVEERSNVTYPVWTQESVQMNQQEGWTYLENIPRQVSRHTDAQVRVTMAPPAEKECFHQLERPCAGQ